MYRYSKKRGKGRWLLLFLLLLSCSLSAVATVWGSEVVEGEIEEEIEEEISYIIRFFNEDGENEFEDLRIEEASDGAVITLPEIPEMDGYRGIGWIVTSEEEEQILKAGEMVTVSSDLDFFAVYEKMCRIQFVDELGEAPADIEVPEGTEVVIPMPSEVEGYRSEGWSINENGETSSFIGESLYSVTSDMTVYPVRNKLYQVTFWTNTGKTTSRLQQLAMEGVLGETIVLPKLPDYSGYQALGWTDQLKGTTVTHKENSTYIITGDQSFYQINKKIHTLTYYNNSGSGSFTDLTQTTVGNSYVTLPKLPQKVGYQALGWSTVKGATAIKFKAGSKVWINKDVKFYAVYKKTKVYTLRFYTYAGGYEYKSLRIKVNAGTTVALPQLPRRLNYSRVGWGTKKCPSVSSLVKGGTKVKVTSNMNFYGYWKSAKTVQFMNNAGTSEYMSLRVDVTGTTIVLPSAFSPKGYTFLGWSDKPNQTSNPKYQMGRKLTVKKGMKLYAVLMKKYMTVPEPSEIAVSEKYDTVFFIGDSRTVGMQTQLKSVLGEGVDKSVFMCQNSVTLTWFQENRSEFLKQIKQTPGKKAVIFNLGVNSLRYNSAKGYLSSTATKYVEEMNSVAASLKNSNCDMYFMSVNPLNDKECKSTQYGGTDWGLRYPQWVQSFNYLVRQNLKGYTYIDTYNYLINTGFELVDGLHYSKATYCKIYNRVIGVIDKKV